MVSSTMSTFADDTKLYHIVKSLQDQLALQQDLNDVMGWGEDLQMSFSFNKCHSMSIGHSSSLFNYTMNSMDQVVILDSTSEEKDFGVLFTNNLKLGHHISAIVRKQYNRYC